MRVNGLVGTLVIVLISGMVIPVFATPVEQISNGDFETGNFNSWTIQTVPPYGNWNINDGTFVPQGPLGPTAPISGNFDAMTDQGGPGINMLSEPFTVPSGVTSSQLSWNDRIFNWANTFSDPNQEIRVEIRDTTGLIVHGIIFDTNPGDIPQQFGPNLRSFDITTLMQSLEGQSVRLCFTQQDNLFFFNYVIDDVSLTIDTAVVGGELLPIDTKSLVLVGIQSPIIWLTTLIITILGIGAYAFTRNPCNLRNVKVILSDYFDRL